MKLLAGGSIHKTCASSAYILVDEIELLPQAEGGGAKGSQEMFELPYVTNPALTPAEFELVRRQAQYSWVEWLLASGRLESLLTRVEDYLLGNVPNDTSHRRELLEALVRTRGYVTAAGRDLQGSEGHTSRLHNHGGGEGTDG